MAGKAISFVLPDQGSKVKEIEKLTRLYLPISKLPNLGFDSNEQTHAPNNPHRDNRSSYKKKSSDRSSHSRRR
jgi:superfamily II DNA/RNA helicase